MAYDIFGGGGGGGGTIDGIARAAIGAHTIRQDNPHTVTKAQVGLSNVVNADTTTTSNITDSVDKRFITDMQKTVLENTSGANTGDETNATIKNKLGPASTTTDGYLAKEDFATFAKTLNGVSMYEERSINEYDFLNPEMNAVFGLTGTTLTSTGFNCIIIPCKNTNQYTICRTKCAQVLCVCESVENPIVGGNVNILLGNLTTPNYESTNTVTTTTGNFLIIFYFSTSMANGYSKSEVQKGVAIRNSQYGTAWLPYKINKSDKLYGKFIAAIGDSYVKGHNLADHQTWLAKIGCRNGMTYYNCGKNGDMIAWNGVNNLDDTSVVRRFDDEMPAYADIVVVFGGHNDAIRSIPIGEDTDSVDTTFKGALNVLVGKAITKYPKALIIFITPSYRHGAEITYSDAMQKIAKLNNILCINTWTDFNFTFKNSVQKLKYDERYVGLYDKYETDKNQFNEEGHERISYIIEQKIRNNIIF